MDNPYCSCKLTRVWPTRWVKHTSSLTDGCGAATLSFGCQTNSNSEECWFDMVEFFEGTAQDPPAMVRRPTTLTTARHDGP